MLGALGHCEDPACVQKNSSSSHELIRLFRCSIHCDKNLCLSHLNAHNVYYEQERRRNDGVIRELEAAFTTYRQLFEQHIATYQELVRQASTILYHSSATTIPTEQIRSVISNIRQSISIFEQEIILQPDPALNMTLLQLKSEEEEKNVIVLDDEHGQTKNMNKENEVPVNPSLSSVNANNNSTIVSSNECHNFVVRIPRISNIDTESSIEIIRSNSQRETSPSTKGQKRTSEHTKKKYKNRLSPTTRKHCFFLFADEHHKNTMAGNGTGALENIVRSWLDRHHNQLDLHLTHPPITFKKSSDYPFMFTADTDNVRITIGFKTESLNKDSSLDDFYSNFNYIALDHLPLPGLHGIPSEWDVYPQTPMSSFSDGVRFEHYDPASQILKLDIETNFFAIYGQLPQQHYMADASLPKGSYFQVRRDIQASIKLHAKLNFN
ncbi:unnamed protein product [Adineta ricciae]|uniref:Uncharacterized protein n=1 Tax=Adineta ricciae TaxID=249248 RepID=A0A814CTT7_ADIRI|nr:unnamed protein product [Adineta ricciae]CAF1536651.1 unnamed protein product [Adineta ricciae]